MTLFDIASHTHDNFQFIYPENAIATLSEIVGANRVANIGIGDRTAVLRTLIKLPALYYGL